VDDVASVVDVAVVLLVVSDAFQEAPQPVRIGITASDTRIKNIPEQTGLFLIEFSLSLCREDG
jgi:hypothetical protein